MADVFISYSKRDPQIAGIVAAALNQSDISTWFDREIEPDENWRRRIQEELSAAQCVLVLWSQNSITREFVIDESSRAKNNGKLIQALVDHVEPPLGFGEQQYHKLIGWHGDVSDARWTGVLKSIRRVLAGEMVQPAATAASGQSSSSRAQKAWITIASSLEPSRYEQFIALYPDHDLANTARDQLTDLRAWSDTDKDDPDAIDAFIITGPFATVRTIAEAGIGRARKAKKRAEKERTRLNNDATNENWSHRFRWIDIPLISMIAVFNPFTFFIVIDVSRSAPPSVQALLLEYFPEIFRMAYPFWVTACTAGAIIFPRTKRPPGKGRDYFYGVILIFVAAVYLLGLPDLSNLGETTAGLWDWRTLSEDVQRENTDPLSAAFMVANNAASNMFGLASLAFLVILVGLIIQSTVMFVGRIYRKLLQWF